MPTHTPSITQLKRALELSEKIQQLEGELSALLGSSANAGAVAKAIAAPAAGKRGRRRRRKGNLSPEARERIAAAQRARWAKTKGTKVAAAPDAPAKTNGRKRKRRAISPEARAKMAEAARRRWAKVKK